MSEKREHQTSKERSKAMKNTTNGGRSAKLKATLRAAAIVLPQQLLHTGMVSLRNITYFCSIFLIVKEYKKCQLVYRNLKKKKRFKVEI